MRIENESQQHFVEKAVIRSEIFREKNNNIMFPYKPPRGVNDDVGNHMTNRGQSYHSNQRHHGRFLCQTSRNYFNNTGIIL